MMDGLNFTKVACAVGLLGAAACGPLPPSGASSEAGGETSGGPGGDPTPGGTSETTGVGTTEVEPTSGGTTDPPECDDNYDCGGYCGYCDEHGECQEGVGCCGFMPIPSGGTEWRCQPPFDYCFEDDDCDIEFYCKFEECLPVPVLPGCGRVEVAAVDVPLLARPDEVLLIDIDVDGDLDLVAVESDAGIVEILLGDGTGTLVTAGAFETGLAGPDQRVAAADFDDDGDPDLAVLRPGEDAEVSLLLGQAGAFGAANVTPLGRLATSIFAGRADADDLPDLVLLHGPGEAPSVRPGDGAGELGPEGPQVAGLDGAALVVGDLDGDPALEVAAAFVSEPGLQVLEHDAATGWAPARKLESEIGTLPEQQVVLGDVEADGTLEIVATRVFNGVTVFHVWRANLVDVMPAETSAGVLAQVIGVSLGDLDGDGAGDLVTMPGPLASELGWVFGDGAAGFKCTGSFTMSKQTRPSLVVTGDLDGDGRAEVIAGDAELPSLRILRVTPL